MYILQLMGQATEAQKKAVSAAPRNATVAPTVQQMTNALMRTMSPIAVPPTSYTLPKAPTPVYAAPRPAVQGHMLAPLLAQQRSALGPAPGNGSGGGGGNVLQTNPNTQIPSAGNVSPVDHVLDTSSAATSTEPITPIPPPTAPEPVPPSPMSPTPGLPVDTATGQELAPVEEMDESDFPYMTWTGRASEFLSTNRRPIIYGLVAVGLAFAGLKLLR